MKMRTLKRDATYETLQTITVSRLSGASVCLWPEKRTLYGTLNRSIIEAYKKLGVTLTFGPRTPTMRRRGWLAFAQRKKVYIWDGMPKESYSWILLHELGHAVLHADTTLPYSTRELEAESVACLVLNEYGQPHVVRSSDYILGYLKTAKTAERKFLESEKRVIDASKALIETIKTV